jgi:hypothetical protein
MKSFTLYKMLLDATLLSCMNAFGSLNKAGIEQGYTTLHISKNSMD